MSTPNPLNFDEAVLTATRYTVTARGESWDLRDDFPAPLGLDLYVHLRMVPLGTRIQQAGNELTKKLGVTLTGELPPGSMEQLTAEVFAAYQANILALCTRLFAWTYPELTAKEVESKLNYDQQIAVLTFFTNQRFPPLTLPRVAGTSPASADAPSANGGSPSSASSAATTTPTS